MFGLDFCDFDNFLFLDLSLRCPKALINLFSHLHVLNLIVTPLTHLKISKTPLWFANLGSNLGLPLYFCAYKHGDRVAHSKLYDPSKDGDLQGRWWCKSYGKGWWVSRFYGV